MNDAAQEWQRRSYPTLTDSLAYRVERLEAVVATLTDALRGLVEETGWDDIDPRLRYVIGQVGRDDLVRARAALGAASQETRKENQ